MKKVEVPTSTTVILDNQRDFARAINELIDVVEYLEQRLQEVRDIHPEVWS